MEYTRLTDKNNLYWAIQETPLSAEIGIFLTDCLNRLAELEDKIEQGTLIELPCKVGDIVYGLSCYRQFGSLSGKIFKGKVIAFYIERGLYLRIEAEHDNGNFYLEYGKEVFLTREEAEKRLKEVQE